MTVWGKVGIVFDRVLGLLALLAAIIFVFIMLAVSGDVVMRYVVHRGTIWVVEISEYCLLWITFLATAWLLREEGHVRMDLVLSRLRSRHQALVNMITSALSIVVCSALVWYGAQVTWQHYQEGLYRYTQLSIPTAPILVIIPVGSFLLTIQFMRRIRGLLLVWRK